MPNDKKILINIYAQVGQRCRWKVDFFQECSTNAVRYYQNVSRHGEHQRFVIIYPKRRKDLSNVPVYFILIYKKKKKNFETASHGW